MNFDKDQINKKTKTFILDNYLNTPEWVIENVYKASKAAGPMAEWVKSIIDYADIFLKIEPLRKEVEELEHQEKQLKN